METRSEGRLALLIEGAQWRAPAIVLFAIVASVGISLFFGFVYEQRPLAIDDENFEVLAGLLVGALAIERLSELLVAPWVGALQGRSSRVAVIGATAILFGVLVAGGLGLRLLDALTETPLGDSDDFQDGIARSADILITGLAIGGGTKPLHDLLSRLGHSVERKKRKDAAGDRTETADLADPNGAPARIELVVRPKKEAVPLDEAGRRVRSSSDRGRDRSDPPETAGEVVAQLRTVWPDADIPSIGPGVPDRLTVSVDTRYRVGSDSYVREAFSRAHHGVGAGLHVIPNLPALEDEPGDAGLGIGTESHRWALEQMKVDAELIRSANGGRGVRVAHLDTGYREHPLGPNWNEDLGYDFLDNKNDPVDPWGKSLERLVDAEIDVDAMRTSGHGTATGSVIGGQGVGQLYSESWWNHSEVIGVAPECEVVPFRVMRGPLHMFDDDVAKAIDRARRQECHIISMALGGYGFIGLEEQIEAAVAEGIIVLAAAGNQVNAVVDPAAYPSVIGVANSTISGDPNQHESSSGPGVSVTAPGTDVWRAKFDDDKNPIAARGTGTSYSVSHVAGLAALWLAEHDRDDLVAAYGETDVPRLFAHVLQESATEWDERWENMGWGSGIVNGRALLEKQVLDSNRHRVVDTETLTEALAGPPPESGANRISTIVASVFTGHATTTLREKLVRFTGRLVARLQGVDNPFQDPDSRRKRQPGVPPLIAAELRYGLRRDPNFTEDHVLEKKASPDLRRTIAEINPRPATEPWGHGLSAPLRRLLTGQRPARVRMQWVGFAALALATAAAFLIGWQRDAAPLGMTGRLTILGVGIYAAAQSIERFLEYVAGPYVFKDRPDRKEERALILLGLGVLLGTVLSLVTGVFILESLAPESLDGAAAGVEHVRGLEPGEASSSLLRSLDILVTGLVVGGGAKPIHDLIERIQLSTEATKAEAT